MHVIGQPFAINKPGLTEEGEYCDWYWLVLSLYAFSIYPSCQTVDLHVGAVLPFV